MAEHLENIEAIFSYALETINFDHILEMTRDMVNSLVADKAFQGLLSGMMAFCEMAKIESLNREVITGYIDKVYAKASPGKREVILHQLDDFLKDLLRQGYAKNGAVPAEGMERIRDFVQDKEKPTFERFKEQATVGILLKLLQGPLYDKMSHVTKDHISSLGTLYGEYLNNDYFLILEDRVAFDVPDGDRDVLYYESTSLLDALSMCLRIYGEARLDVLSGGEAAKVGVFGVVGKSLARLLELAQAKDEGTDPTEEFVHNLVVGIFLMYAQDPSTSLLPEERKKVTDIAAFYRKMSDRYLRKKREIR